MAFLNVIKRNAQAKSAGKLVASPMQAAVAQPVEGTPAPAAAPAAAPAPASPGFQLPELDPNDPDYAEKKQIHDAFVALDAHFNKALPGVDYQKHYADIQAEMAKAPQERHLSPLSKLAIAMGTQNPNNPYAPNVGLAMEDQTAKGVHAQEQSDFEKTLEMKKAAIEGHFQQLLGQGEFRKALALADVKARNDLTAERLKGEREHKNKLEEIEAQNTGRANVARINAQGAMDRAERRLAAAKSASDKLNLSPSDKSQMHEEYAAAARRFNMAVAADPNTGMRPEQDVIDQAEELHRREIMRIHDFYESREIGTRPPNAGPVKETASSGNGRPSGAAWEAAAKQ